MRKLFSILGALLLSTSLWAGSYTITFKAEGSGDGSAITAASTKCSDIVSDGADYLDGTVVEASKANYNGKNGVKLGISGTAGKLKLNLSAAGKVKATTIVVNCVLYNSGKAATLSVNGEDAQSVPAAADNLTFTINDDITYIEFSSSKYMWVKSVTVNYDDVTPPTTQKIYFAPTGTGENQWCEKGAKTAVYYYGHATEDAAFTDYISVIEQISGTNIFEATIPLGYTKVIFVRFDPARTAPIEWTDTWGQTVDIDLEDGKNLYTISNDERDGEGKWKNGSWSSYTAPTMMDVYYVKSNDWPNLNIYSWKGGKNNCWPGVAMTATGSKLYGLLDIYKGSISNEYENVIFSNNGSDQTSTYAFTDHTKPYFYSGEWFSSASAIPATCYIINSLTSGTATLARGATVLYADGAYAYLYDGTGGALIYLTGHNLNTGDTITVEVAGACQQSNNLPEFVPNAAIADADKKKGETPIIPDAVKAPIGDYLNRVVVYRNVTFASSEYSSKNIKGKWGDEEITFRDQFNKNIKFDTDKKYDIVAATSVYKTDYQAYIISAEKVCQDGPYGLNVNGVADTLKPVDAVGFDQYGIDNKVVEKDDEILLENLSCNVTWLPQIEDGGAKDNFEVVGDKLKVKVAGTYNFYFKKIPGDEKLYIDYSPITKWYIAGGFNKWTLNDDSELKATEKADSIAIVIELKSDTAVNFKLVRVVTKGSDVSTWYGLKKDSEGKVDEMRYGHSSGFWFYNDGLEEVKLHPTNANDNYTFGVNISNPDIPVVTVIIPEEKPIEKTFKVKVPAGTEKVYMAADWDPAVDGWEFEEMEADGENQFKLTASVLKSFEYKYSAAEDWEHEEVAADRSAIENRKYKGGIDEVALFKNPKWSNIYLWRKSNGYAGEELLMEDPTKPELLSVPVNYTAAMLDSFLIVDTRDGIKYYKIANDAEDMSRANSIQWTLVENDARNVAINIDQAGGYIFVWEPDDHKISVLYPAEPKIDITFQVKVPEGTENCYIAGDWEGDGTWTFKQMSKVDAIDHQFELKVEDIVASVPYKYSAAEDWEHGEVNGDRSYHANRTYAGGIDEVALFKNPKWTNIYLWRKSNDWKAEEFETTENADSIVVKVTYAAAVLDSFLIKDGDQYYKIDPSAVDMSRASSTDWGLGTGDGKRDVSIDIDQAGDYIFIWKKSSHDVSVIYPAQEKVAITFKVKAPEGTVDCYIAGDWAGDGNWTFKQMGVVDAIDHQFELKVEDIVATVPYKYSAAADWEHVEVNADRSLIAGNRTYAGDIDEVALFMNPDWTNVFLKGAFTDWNEVEFQKTDVATVLSLSSSIEAGIVDFVIVDRSGDYEKLYKIAEGASNYNRAASESVDEADRWWGLAVDGPEMKNVWLDADVNGLYNFQWATDTQNIKIVFPTATGCENVYGTDVELRKVIENGVLYIYRDGKVYNVQGQLVK